MLRNERKDAKKLRGAKFSKIRRVVLLYVGAMS
jgi:hypothetical protein